MLNIFKQKPKMSGWNSSLTNTNRGSRKLFRIISRRISGRHSYFAYFVCLIWTILAHVVWVRVTWKATLDYSVPSWHIVTSYIWRHPGISTRNFALCSTSSLGAPPEKGLTWRIQWQDLVLWTFSTSSLRLWCIFKHQTRLKIAYTKIHWLFIIPKLVSCLCGIMFHFRIPFCACCLNAKTKTSFRIAASMVAGRPR